MSGGSNRPENRSPHQDSAFRALVERLPEALVYMAGLDQLGAATYVGPQVEAFFGCTRDEYLGDPALWVNSIHPEDREGVIAEVTRCHRSGESLDIEYRIQHRDGRILWVRNRAGFVRDEEGNPVDLLGVLTNITELRSSEDKLQQSVQFLRDVFDAIQDGLSLLDPEMTVVAANRWMESMYPERLPLAGCKCFNVYQLREEVCPWCPVVVTLETGKTCTKIVPYPSGEAPEGWMELTAFPLLDEDGRVKNVIEYVKNITDRKIAEDALRASEERYRMSQRLARIGTWEWNIETDDVFWSDEVHAMWGFQPGEFKGTFEEVAGRIHPDDLELWREDVRRCVEEGKEHHIQFRIVSTDGTERWIAAFGDAERDENGRAQRMMGVVMDVTASRRAEEEHRSLEDRLVRAQRLESVGRLAGGVAHDFNNMLSVILGHVDLALKEENLSPAIQTSLEEIRAAGQRSAHLTRQLLGVARRQTIEPDVLDLNETVGDTIKMLRRLIGEEIDLIWRPAVDLRNVYLDRGQVDQILANLCVNARDAIGGVGTINIETQNAAFDEAYCDAHPGFLPGEYVLLAVTDDGCGMDGETLSQLFEPFFTTKGEGIGTGLGLATVYGIVKQNEGFIDVESRPGEGTTFTIYLPCHEPGVVAPRKEEIAGIPEGDQETILLVEDETAILKMGKKMMERLGYRVLAANKPSEAIRLAEEHVEAIDLLVTDVVMPEMTGRELAERLRNARSELKVLYMSGYAADVIAHHGILREGITFLQKPFSIQDLATRIREAIGRRD